MPEYLSPGVYVEEVDSGSKPIEGVGTAMAAFIGFAPGGEFNKAELVTNWTQFCEKFGDTTGSPWIDGGYLAHSIYGYFNNGGTRCYVVRVPRKEDIPTNGARQIPAQAARGQLGPLQIRALTAGPEGNDIKVEVQKVGEEPVTEKFRLVVTRGEDRETFEGSGRQPLNLRNVKTAVRSQLIEIVEVSEETLQETSIQLAEGQAARTLELGAGAELKANDFIGDEAKRKGLGGFSAVDDITMLCCPDLMAGLYTRQPLQPKLRAAGKGFLRTCAKCKSELDPRGEDGSPKIYESQAAADAAAPVQKCPQCGAMGEEVVDREALDARRTDLVAWQTGMLNHCERMHDRVAILDSPPGMTPLEIKTYRMKEANFDSKFGTLYYPWIQVQDPRTKAPTYVPPCGHMAGIWARNDSERGVHKAPANEVVRGAIDLEYSISKGEQDVLNPEGINCVREFPGRGRRVWGARTLSSDPSWRYLNIRRLFNYLEKSIEKGTQWVVFEPNDYDLWQRVSRNIGAFLRLHWQEGMLFGATADDAFFVKCDSETNPQESIELGRLVCEIGVRPVYPAEFVIFRIGQWSGGSSTSE